MGPDVAKKRGNPSKNYSPPIPPTRIPFLLTPDLFYVRFVEFSVCPFLPSFLSLLPPKQSYCDVVPMRLILYLVLSFSILSAAPAASMENSWKIQKKMKPFGPKMTIWGSFPSSWKIKNKNGRNTEK